MSKQKERAQSDQASGLPTCFIIMPISDHENYSPGHFDRVYEHIIKPACALANFKPIRADDVKSTNVIAIDIVRKIVNSDMALCDLSSQNPNVLYEVGIRQAFNLPVTFIKDSITDRIFDVSLFRDTPYDHTLRVDTVASAINEIAEVIINTYSNKAEVNSLVTLLGIEAAKVSHTTISVETNLILSSLKNIEYRLNKVERPTSIPKMIFKIPDQVIPITRENMETLSVGDQIFTEAFGPGLVKVVEGNLPDIKVTVLFEHSGTKYLLARFAKIYRFPKG